LVLQSIERAVRVRFLHTRYPHLGSHSGYVQFVRELDKGRFHCSVHASSDSDIDVPSWLMPIRPLYKRLVTRSQMRWYKQSDLHAELIAFGAGMAGRLDVVHFLDGEHSGRYMPRFVKATGRSCPKTVATFHQPPELLKDLLHVESLRWLDQIILVSPTQLEFFRPHVAEEKLNVILHGVDTAFFEPKPGMNSSQSARPTRCITVGHWLRDWKTFGDVAREMPEVQFDVVSGRDTGAESLANVRVHRGLDDHALAVLYREADILFLPLLDSTANNALLEGLASGLAVVSTDLGATRAYVPDGTAILLENRPGDFVRAIRRLTADAALLQEMKRRARARAEELSWPRLARTYEAFYSTLAAPLSGR
jgi:glycosyltransferase involved in cell wall biosynthesis